MNPEEGRKPFSQRVRMSSGTEVTRRDFVSEYMPSLEILSEELTQPDTFYF